ncbi:signal-regulatory protein beta-2-like isoform 1-T1 [Clarias gariepinus]
MKPFPLHTLILLGVLHHFGSCSECESRCEPKFERVGENVTIKCSITNPDQDGVYLYTQREETSTEERVLYYYKEGKPDGVLTPETPYEGRVEINRDFGDFSVSISNVSEQDSGVYWCRFNKLDVNTISQRTCLFVQSECESRCAPMFVRVGKKVTIKCSITNPDQDGVYLYTQREETSKEETVLYYYGLKQTLTPETPYKDRVETNRDFRDFSVSIRNVSKHDMGFYWCRFNKFDKNTNSTDTFLFVQPEIIHTCKEEGDIKEYKEECVWKKFAYILAGMFIFTLIILVVVLVRMCTDRRNDPPRRQPSNGVYEVMRSNTMTALTNPAYESSKKRIQSQSC